MTPDNPATGLVLALSSAAAFGLSGALARGLMDAGWSPGAAVSIRVSIAALVLVGPGLLALRGRWSVLRANIGLLTFYGLLAVAGAQLCYFLAVQRLDVGVALLIEYTAPVTVVLWMWARHAQRPGPLTAAGAALAAVGLVLLLDVVSGGSIDTIGVLWALGAMVGAAAYFIVSADESTGLPPITLAAGGLVVGSAALLLAGAVGVLPLTATTTPVDFVTGPTPWWVPVMGLGLVTAAFAYVAGIAATRRLGSRLGSFVALTEVLAALIFAWALLDQVPQAMQLTGAALVLAGVIVVKLGERTVSPGHVDDLVVEVVPAERTPGER